MRNVYLLLLIWMLFSCSRDQFDSASKYQDFISDETNGYLQKKTVNGIHFTLQYKPTDMLVEQEIVELSEENISTLRNKYKQYLYFNLGMSKDNRELLSATPKNRNEFGAMVNQLAFGMGDRVNLISAARDTLPLLDFIYPRMYGMSGSTNILFVYSRDENSLNGEFLNFIIQDIGLFTGEVKFKIPTTLIIDAPTLSFNKKS